MIAAQLKAAAVQSLPKLPIYTGEDVDAADDIFERWLMRELFLLAGPQRRNYIT